MLSIRVVVIAVMIAACISSWHHCLPRAKMARSVRGHQAPWTPEGTCEPDTNISVPQKGGQRVTKERKAIANYDLDIDYKPERTDLGIKAVHEEEEDSDAEYKKMELPWARILLQRMMNCKVAARIKKVHWAWWPEIMAPWLQDMYLLLRFSPETTRLFIREQQLGSSEWHKVLTDKNVDDICNIMRKPGSNNAGMSDRVQQVSVIAQENLKLAVSLFHYWWRCIFDWKVTEAQCICY